MNDLSWSLYLPVFVLFALYAAIQLLAPIAARRDDDARERLLDVGFIVALVSAAYVVLLLIIALVSLPDIVLDAITVIAVIVVFFGVLLLAFFSIFELVFARGARRARRG